LIALLLWLSRNLWKTSSACIYSTVKTQDTKDVFEWAWQNPTKTKRLQHLNLRKIPRKETVFKFNLRVERKPPDHMPICHGPVKSKNLKKNALPTTPTHTKCLLCSKYITNHLKISCLNPSCELVCHITCLAELMLPPGEYVPIEGDCPFCGVNLKWGDLIRKMKGCKMGDEINCDGKNGSDGDESDMVAANAEAPCRELNDGNKIPLVALGTGRGTAAEGADGSPDDVDYLETWEGMQEAKDLGLTSSIGVSNFNISQIDRLVHHARICPAVNEVEVNPTLTQGPLVSHCHDLNIAVMAYSPFGFLVSRKQQDAPPPRHDDPTLVAMADNHIVQKKNADI
ncbi:Uncharacterized protein OBRU01_00176, partial [Operophtera brumata]